MKQKSSYTPYILILILLTCIGLFIASVYSYFIQTPIYESKTELIVQPINKEQSDIQTLVQTCEEMIGSKSFIEHIQQQLQSQGLSYSVSELEQDIQTSIPNHGQMIHIRVTTSRPTDSQTIANTIVNNYKQEIGQVMNQSMDVSVISKPTFDAQNKNKHYPILVMGSIVGLIIGCIICLIYFKWNSNIKTLHSLNRMKAPVIGSIPQMTKREQSVRIHRVSQEEEEVQNKQLEEENKMVDQLLRQETQQLDTLIRRRRKR